MTLYDEYRREHPIAAEPSEFREIIEAEVRRALEWMRGREIIAPDGPEETVKRLLEGVIDGWVIRADRATVRACKMYEQGHEYWYSHMMNSVATYQICIKELRAVFKAVGEEQG